MMGVQLICIYIYIYRPVVQMHILVQQFEVAGLDLKAKVLLHRRLAAKEELHVPGAELALKGGIDAPKR